MRNYCLSNWKWNISMGKDEKKRLTENEKLACYLMAGCTLLGASIAILCYVSNVITKCCAGGAIGLAIALIIISWHCKNLYQEEKEREYKKNVLEFARKGDAKQNENEESNAEKL